jgi:hypothetical protein
MKIFTLDEANALLPTVSAMLEQIRELYGSVESLRESAAAAAAAADRGGGMAGGTTYVRSLYEIGRLTTELNDLGVQLKDHKAGLVDFPTMHGGRLVLLCWKLGEPETIEFWHDVDAGYAGRQPL